MKPTIFCDPPKLKDFTKQIFYKSGVAIQDANTQAELLIWANLRGIDSHGVQRIPTYLEWIETGIMNPKPNIIIEKETPATLLVEADKSPGPVVTKKITKMLIEKASKSGISWANIRNTTHQGAMGYYSLMAADAGMVGISIVCSPPNMAPTGSIAAGVHNSPISIAVPGLKKNHICLDMATSIAAGGKIQLAAEKGIKIPSDWALDPKGNPTTDPNIAEILLPAGGPKGSGLALMFECITSLMVNNPLITTFIEAKKPRTHIQNSVIAVLNISHFTDLEEYKNNISRLIESIKSLPKNNEINEIMMPGEPEKLILAHRAKEGIPIPETTWSKLSNIANTLDIDSSNVLVK